MTELSAAEIELVTKLRKGCSQPGSAQQGRAAAARHLHALGAYLRAAATVRAATEVVPEQYRKRRTARAATPAARVRQTAKAG